MLCQMLLKNYILPQCSMTVHTNELTRANKLEAVIADAVPYEDEILAKN